MIKTESIEEYHDQNCRACLGNISPIARQNHIEQLRQSVGTEPVVVAGPIKNGEFEVKDSGRRHVFETGAQRDAGPGKGYFHCLPKVAIEALAKLYEAGARKYGRDNWKKGIPLSNYIDSMHRHAFSLNEAMVDEDHAAAVMWNAAGFIWTANAISEGRLPASLDNIGWLASRAAKNSPAPAPQPSQELKIDEAALRQLR